MAFQTTTAASRSYTNINNSTPDIHRNGPSASSSATLGNGIGPWGIKTSSIWRTASLTSPFVPNGSITDNVDGKKGSGSLLASSESDNVPTWRAANATSSSRAGDSSIRINTTNVQPSYRESGSVDLSRNGNLSPTALRAPAINLTNATFANTRPVLATAQHSAFYGTAPPNVYTKYKGSNGRPVDSVVSPTSTTASPLGERRPQWPATYTSSVNNSRDPSRAPTSSHSDIPFNFNSDWNQGRQSNYSDRAQSISSQYSMNSNVYTNGNTNGVNPEYLPAAFSQLGINDQQDKPAFRGHVQQQQRHQHQSQPYSQPPSRPHPQSHQQQQNGYSYLAEYLEGGDLERDLTRYNAAAYNTGSNFLYSNARIMQDPRVAEFQPGLPFATVQYPARTQQDLALSHKQSPSWQDASTGAASRRPTPPPAQQQPQQTLIDQRYIDDIAIKDQYLFHPYNLATLQDVAPYVDYYNMSLNNINQPLTASIPAQLSPLDLVGDGVQSAKLYDFKLAGKHNRRYELKDIYDHIAEFAGDQHGSRFIQTKLETANSDEKERVFREIEPNAIPLMTDVFGNYVIQKFFDHGQQEHKKILASKMRGQVLNLSTQMYGCRVVQKALEHVLLEQQAALVGELENHVMKCVKDQNGNHVIQKAIERCPPETIAFVYQSFIGQVHTLSLHPYGCRVIQRCLERQDNFPVKAIILEELHEGVPKGMIGDSYGNYVVQHVVENGPEKDRQHVLNIVLSDLEGYSKHKFASNVVEKCIQYSNDGWRRRVVEILTTVDERRTEAEGVLVGLIKDSYGNYVIQKLLDSLSPQDFVYFHQHLQPAMAYTKRIGSGKQVVSIEKKMQRFEDLVNRTLITAAGPFSAARSKNHVDSSCAQQQHHSSQRYQAQYRQQQSQSTTDCDRTSAPLLADAGYRYEPDLKAHGPVYPLSIPATSAYAGMCGFSGSMSNTPPPLTADSRSIQSSGLPSINGDAVEGATSMSRKNSEVPVDSALSR